MGPLGWALIVLGLLAGLLSVITLVGVFMPGDHIASRQLALKKPPAEVWKVVRNIEQWPAWWKMLAKVAPLPADGDQPRYMLHYADGRNQFALKLQSENEPTQMVTEIDDVRKMFEGTWKYEITGTAEGCTIRITENGSIPNPLVRLMGRMMMNPTMYIDSYLAGLAGHFGEPADIRP